MSNIVKQESRLPSLQMSEPELMEVLESSLYPGAKPASIKMVIGYCKAAGLDPLQKPVHIVPMWDSKANSMRDVIMPGVGSYRTQAARSGCAGVSEPEFGPDTTDTIGGVSITYPAWCRVTAKRRLATGEIVEFTARELWRENYAVKGGKDKSIAPNAMWTKRPYGQLAKCAEAQALRKAFPEVGAAPTADEMAGKSIDDEYIETVPVAPSTPAAPQPYDQTHFDANFPKWSDVIAKGRKTPADLIVFIEAKGNPLTEKQKARILSVKRAAADMQDVQSKAKAPTFAEVADRINAAETHVELDALDETIGAVVDAQQRAELVASVERRREAIPAFD